MPSLPVNCDRCGRYLGNFNYALGQLPSVCTCKNRKDEDVRNHSMGPALRRPRCDGFHILSRVTLSRGAQPQARGVVRPILALVSTGQHHTIYLSQGETRIRMTEWSTELESMKTKMNELAKLLDEDK